MDSFNLLSSFQSVKNPIHLFVFIKHDLIESYPPL
jgi:hypothetical protein